MNGRSVGWLVGLQDNICVLNTALVFFIFARRAGQLTHYLKALRAVDARGSPSYTPPLLPPPLPSSHPNPSSSSSTPAFPSPPTSTPVTPRGSGSVLKNFRFLLDFWQEYYMRKREKDIASLHYSTNIPFAEWSAVVEVLCAPPDSPTSLRYNPRGSCPPPHLAASMEGHPRRC